MIFKPEKNPPKWRSSEAWVPIEGDAVLYKSNSKYKAMIDERIAHYLHNDWEDYARAVSKSVEMPEEEFQKFVEANNLL